MKLLTRTMICLFPVILILGTGPGGAAAEDTHIPVIYCTDLFHPHDDPDDHFDLACLYAIPEVDIKAVILDQGAKQSEKPGRIPVAQLNRLTGREAPAAIGLAEPLTGPEDTGKQQPETYQEGVKTILSVLRKSSRPVTVIAVGSLRDIAAAYNRNPKLCRKKIGKLCIFIGEASTDFREYNVKLDVHAYRCIMNAPLPMYWVPCFDGGIWVNNGSASFWQASHKDLLAGTADPVLNFFLYMWLQKTAEDPGAALFESPAPEEKTRLLAETRNLWCCAVFPWLADRMYVVRKGICRTVPRAALQPGDMLVEPFSFVPVAVHVDENGKASYEDTAATRQVHRFQVNDTYPYADYMTSVTNGLLRELSRNSTHPQGS